MHLYSAARYEVDHFALIRSNGWGRCTPWLQTAWTRSGLPSRGIAGDTLLPCRTSWPEGSLWLSSGSEASAASPGILSPPFPAPGCSNRSLTYTGFQHHCPACKYAIRNLFLSDILENIIWLKFIQLSRDKFKCYIQTMCGWLVVQRFKYLVQKLVEWSVSTGTINLYTESCFHVTTDKNILARQIRSRYCSSVTRSVKPSHCLSRLTRELL